MSTQNIDLLPVDTASFQKRAQQAEMAGKWPVEWINYAAKNKLFHLAVPMSYGGSQLSLPKLFRLLKRASKLDGSFGWTLTLGAGAGLFTAFMNPYFAETHFSNPYAFITGSGYPAGKTTANEGEYKVNGKWKYATGAPHATLFTATCSLPDQSTKIFALYPEEVSVAQSWNSYGLKATASHNFSVQNITVPADRTFNLASDYLRINAPLYRFPFESFAECTLAASLLGIAEHFQQEAIDLIRSKTSNSCNVTKTITQAKDSLAEARKKLLRHVVQAWESCIKEKQVELKLRNAISSAVKEVSKTALVTAQNLYIMCGMQILNKDSPVNRAWRDLHTCCQHIMLNPE